jgi:hypothetical protein
MTLKMTFDIIIKSCDIKCQIIINVKNHSILPPKLGFIKAPPFHFARAFLLSIRTVPDNDFWNGILEKKRTKQSIIKKSCFLFFSFLFLLK